MLKIASTALEARREAWNRSFPLSPLKDLSLLVPSSQASNLQKCETINSLLFKLLCCSSPRKLIQLPFFIPGLLIWSTPLLSFLWLCDHLLLLNPFHFLCCLNICVPRIPSSSSPWRDEFSEHAPCWVTLDNEFNLCWVSFPTCKPIVSTEVNKSDCPLQTFVLCFFFKFP